MHTPSWWYDEFQQLGVDFANVEEVRAYDAKQGTAVEDELVLVETLRIAADDTVIEFGCGTGAFTVAAAQQCRHVIAVDISNAMLDFTAERAASYGLSNVTCCQAGFLSYEHSAKPANFVVTKFALHHLPDFSKSVALVNMYNALDNGGRLFLKDVVFSFAPAQHNAPINHWIHSFSGSGSSFSKEQFEAHIRDEYSTYGFILEGLLADAGFVIEKSEYLSLMYAQYTCIKK